MQRVPKKRGWGAQTKNSKQNVDAEIGIEATLKENTKRRQDDGKDDLADITGE